MVYPSNIKGRICCIRAVDHAIVDVAIETTLALPFGPGVYQVINLRTTRTVGTIAVQPELFHPGKAGSDSIIYFAQATTASNQLVSWPSFVTQTNSFLQTDGPVVFESISGTVGLTFGLTTGTGTYTYELMLMKLEA